MKIEIQEYNKRVIDISIPIGTSIDDEKEWKDLIKLIIKDLIEFKDIAVCVMKPVKGSIAYEIDGDHKKDNDILIVKTDSLDSDFLDHLPDEDEFYRGLLRIIFNIKDEQEINDRLFLDYPSTENSVVYCENDGLMLTIINPPEKLEYYRNLVNR